MWKDIKGYEGYYQVSDDGQVRSLDRKIYQTNGHPLTYKGHIMKQSEQVGKNRKDGYLVVNLRRDCKSNVIPVHRLVAMAFIENKDNLPTINHIDGNKHNNHVSNLQYVSYSDNNIHALVHHLRNPKSGVKVVQYDSHGNYVATYKSIVEASKATGLNHCSISHCVCGIQDHTYDGSRFVRV